MSDAIVVSPDEIWGRLSKALGQKTAEKAVKEEIQALGLDASRLDFDAALLILKHLAERDGLLGVASRFARSRWMLQRSRCELSGSRRNPNDRDRGVDGPKKSA